MQKSGTAIKSSLSVRLPNSTTAKKLVLQFFFGILSVLNIILHQYNQNSLCSTTKQKQKIKRVKGKVKSHQLEKEQYIEQQQINYKITIEKNKNAVDLFLLCSIYTSKSGGSFYHKGATRYKRTEVKQFQLTLPFPIV